MQTILSLDTQITHILSYFLPHNQLLDVVFTFLSVGGNYVVIWALAIIGLLLLEGKKHWKFPLIFLMTLLVTLALVDVVFKPLFQRDRPYVVQNVDSPVCPRNYSFPSGHAGGSFAGAAILAWYDKKRKGMYYTIASLVSFSRIYLQCHYVLDVTFGAVIGYYVAQVILYFASHSVLRTKTKRN